jgi:hypothetical protein
MDWWRRYDDLVHRVIPIVGGLCGTVFLLVRSGPGAAVVPVGSISVDAFYCGRGAFVLWFCLGVYWVFEDDPYEHLP